jgi:ubiquinone/menaquinone biosynthesis C-methylase UbiE
MQRVVTPELLDSDAGTPREIEDSFTDLRMINHRFGGIRTLTSLLHEVARRTGLNKLRYLDVAGGAGDVASLVGESLAESGIQLETVVLDRAASHLNGKHPGICGDALALPCADNSFDVVGSTLFIHHLEPEEFVNSAREALRVARYGMVVNDLIRNSVHYWLAVAGRALYRSRLTWHDAPVSVQRAYTMPEMRAMLLRSGAAAVEINAHYLFRMGAIAWKQKPTTT